MRGTKSMSLMAMSILSFSERRDEERLNSLREMTNESDEEKK